MCGGATTTTGDSSAVATPTVLAGQKTWGPTQLALVISVLFAGLLILLPPMTARVLDGRTPRPRRAAAPVAAPTAPPTSSTQASSPRDPDDLTRVAP